ncbi:tetratricopeptide repeat protein [Christiangramia sabulilitoris]|uniref:Tetratricopeptide repeat protein n=1 Tax=Christiangramia sabulilitoris TaxID=2583991 RepID=A0A550I920_9FLAO|nr:tetratricopeptide repeat protein [Christiangramia sabulilitoris]TRO67477.1 tetratricopeptide repeat protein [Christiangramia sabulilitoris]
MKPYKALKVCIAGVFGLFWVLNMNAQEKPEKLARESNRYIADAQDALAEDDFAVAEAYYRKAIATDPSNTTAKYNMGNLYYTKEKSLNAEDRLKEAAEIAQTKTQKHRIFHNLGNSYMQQKNYQAAVDAFKNALRNDPTDEETRYNLALAKKMLEKEQQNEQGDQDQKKQDQENKDQNQDQQNRDQNQDGEGGEDEKEDQKPKDQGDNEKDKKEGDQNEDKQKDKGDEQKEDQQKGDKEKQQQQRPTQGQLSPQQIQSLLEAMNNEEKKVQDKINAQKAKGVKVKTEKDW